MTAQRPIDVPARPAAGRPATRPAPKSAARPSFEPGGAAVAVEDGRTLDWGTVGRHALLTAGALDVFARDGDGRLSHVGRLGHGALLAPPQASGVTLVAVARGAVTLHAMTPADFADAIRSPQGRSAIAQALDGWFALLDEAVGAWVPPEEERPNEALRPGDAVDLGEGDRVSTTSGIAWIAVSEDAAFLGGAAPLGGPIARIMPIGPNTWLRTSGRASALATASVLDRGDWMTLTDRAGTVFLQTVAAAIDARSGRELDRLAQTRDTLGRDLRRTMSSVVSVVVKGRKTRTAAGGGDPALVAMQIAGDALGIDLGAPARPLQGLGDAEKIDLIARASHLRSRPIALRGRWWRDDSGPLVVFRKDGGGPAVAVRRKGRYRLILPEAPDEAQPVGPELDGQLEATALQLYPPLPHRKISWSVVLLHGFSQIRGEIARLLLFGLLAALLAMALPAAAAHAVGTLIPDNAVQDLVLLGAAVGATVMCSAAIRFAADLAGLRIEGVLATRVVGAVIDRLLNMPQRFFDQFTTADLSLRASAMDAVRRTLTLLLTAGCIGGVTMIVSGLVLLLLAPWVALVAAAMGVSIIAAGMAAGRAQFKAILEGEALNANVISFVFELINAVGLLRSTASESRAFVRWSEDFLEMRARIVRSRRIGNLFDTVLAGHQVLAVAAVFATVALLSGDAVEPAAFLAVIAAFAAFNAASVQLAASAQAGYQMMPLVRRVGPLLENAPEVAPDRTDPGPLSGAIEVQGVAFRYTPDGPRILDGINVAIKRGESVAIVGVSGCGKSTLLRIMLGLLTPVSGGVYYDGHDLRQLDLQAVRRQFGVILQQSAVVPGSIYENIAAGLRLSMTDAWAALRQVGLEGEVQAMPMGLHTVITEGATGLSGGQVQRLLLARALAGRPRILFLDEATSGLDNATQAMVTEALDRVPVTRIVVAHRLSTVRRCDRILVMDKGKIVQEGTFADLIGQRGLFADLARRQLA